MEVLSSEGGWVLIENEKADQQLKLTGLSKTYRSLEGEVPALAQTSVAVPAGQFLCILGPSGCGKTTILKLLAGLETPSSGEILWRGRRGLPPDLGMVFQDQGLFPWMKVGQNIRFLLENNPAIDKAEIDSIVQGTLADIGLRDFSELYPYQLSGGMRQRVSIGRAFANRPQLLLLDEPFVFLDYQTRWSLQQLLLRLWYESNMTVIFVTHDIEEAVLLADRILVFTAHPGRIKFDTPVVLERPRNFFQLKHDPRYHSLVAELTDLMRDEFEGG